MTLSRRDEFATRAMAAIIEKGGVSLCYVAEESRKIANELALQLDRTAPKPKRVEIEDDGREIRCVQDDSKVELLRTGRKVRVVGISPLFKTEDARLFAHRILKLCDEIEGK